MPFMRLALAFVLLLVGPTVARAGILEDKIAGVWRKTNTAEWRAAPGIGQLVTLELSPAGPNGVGRAVLIQIDPTGRPHSQPATWRIHDTGNRSALDRFELRLSWRREDGRNDGIRFHLRALTDRDMTLEYPSMFMAILQSRVARFARAR